MRDACGHFVHCASLQVEMRFEVVQLRGPRHSRTAGFDSTSTLLTFVWPAGLPPGTWTLEARCSDRTSAKPIRATSTSSLCCRDRTEWRDADYRAIARDR